MCSWGFVVFACLGIALPRQSSGAFSLTECGSTKTCLQLPDGCDPTSSDCLFFSWMWNGTVFNMELSGGSGAGETYAAVAFGKANAMQDADLYYCTGTALSSGVIRTRYLKPTQLPDLPSGVTQTMVSNSDGLAKCTFDRVPSVTQNISGNTDQAFDLAAESHYILLAHGNMTAGDFGYHGDEDSNRFISTDVVNMTALSGTAGCGSTMGCFQEPAGCTEGMANCTYFTWVYNPDANNFDMTISGGSGSGATYASVAFGLADVMQDADLYFCTGNRLVSSAITTLHDPPTNQNILEGTITNISTVTTDGVARCTFTRAANITKPISDGTNKGFDLTTGSYHVLLAQGGMEGDEVDYHYTRRAISSTAISMTANPPPSIVAQETSPENRECGEGIGCFETPQGCTEGTADCTYFTWVYNSDTNNFNMTISGGAGSGGTYASVAFGQVDAMQDADLYFCTGDGLVSSAITTLHEPPTNQDISGEAISDITAATTNGVAKCTFTRAASIRKPISGGDNKDFDLTAGSYHILLAQGTMESDGTVSYHDTKRRISPTLIDMTKNEGSPATTAAPPTTNCGDGRGCFQSPQGCTEGTPTCTYFTWVYNSADRSFDMTISGGAGGGGTYAGVAFGLANVMQDADLYFCTGNGLVSSAITDFHDPPTNQDISTEPISDITFTTTNGVARCTFKRAASVTKPITGGTTRDYDLTDGSYYILLAQGSMNSDGTVGYHGTSRSISGSAVDMTSDAGANTAGAHVLKKAHGALMITAWLLLANLGVALARHFKPLWPTTQPGGVKLWFTLHRFVMVTTLLCTAVAFIIIFVHVKGYSSGFNAHAIIGIIVMALTILNPTIALMRPHPNTPKRPIFNWTHYLIGTCARGLGTANLFLGVIAIGASMAPWSIPVLGGYVGFVVLIEIILEILSYKYGHCTRKRNTPPKPDPAPSGTSFEIEEPKVRVRGQGVKTCVLVIYALGLIAFSIALYVALSQA